MAREKSKAIDVKHDKLKRYERIIFKLKKENAKLKSNGNSYEQELHEAENDIESLKGRLIRLESMMKDLIEDNKNLKNQNVELQRALEEEILFNASNQE